MIAYTEHSRRMNATKSRGKGIFLAQLVESRPNAIFWGGEGGAAGKIRSHMPFDMRENMGILSQGLQSV